ncbi:type VI secretion system protein TssA [Rodentibacter myodis]|uniref:Type VI secretion system ImpA domain-containing protein n=1 Tax=Rodentibacter myodis TaxID=1907939 RepID=A0A1V3JGM1_9PAST|nr:type VI secretion system protein TssA [Rodentibacter myodis]OOF55432.1 type VI secretion system ImpA domain-containing protein [Rodentibacter myodis]
MKYQDILNDIIGEGSPVGIPDEEGAVFSAIDEQVIKFGSLQHDSINWDELINYSTQYLSNICKDYKVLQYLGYALLHKAFKSNLLDFLSLFSEFNKKYLFVAYPKPSKDNTVNRFKEKSINLIFERIENAMAGNSSIEFTYVEYDRSSVLISELISQLTNFVSNAESVLNRLQRFVKERSNSKEKLLTIEKNSNQNLGTIQIGKSATLSVQETITNEPSNFPNIDRVDLTNSRRLKQFYLQVADTTCSIEPASVLGYVSRRFGLWYGITQLPEMNAQGNTMMQSVSADKVSDYTEQITSSPSTDLLERIEKTVTTSPYWIEGSYLSAKCCQALKFNEAAEAIRNVTRQFVDKYPMFNFAKFQNGEPFLNEIVSNWLFAESMVNPSNQISSMGELMNDFEVRYSSDGFMSVLKLIDEQLKSAIDIRSRHYLQFEKIRLFLKEGMQAIALNELSELIDNSKKYVVEEWDSTFFKQLEQFKKQIIKG